MAPVGQGVVPRSCGPVERRREPRDSRSTSSRRRVRRGSHRGRRVFGQQRHSFTYQRADCDAYCHQFCGSEQLGFRVRLRARFGPEQ